MVTLNVPHVSQPIAEMKDGRMIVNPDWHRFFDQLQSVAATLDDSGLTTSGIATVAIGFVPGIIARFAHLAPFGS